MDGAASPLSNALSSTGVGDVAGVPRDAGAPAAVSTKSGRNKHSKHACEFPKCNECDPEKLVRWASGNIQNICLKHAHPECAAGCGTYSEEPLSLAKATKPWYYYLPATEH